MNIGLHRVSRAVLVLKIPPANAGDVRVASSVPRSGRALVESMASHSNILAWKNPMDRGVWQATVHGAARGQTAEAT